jgi:hypothetical protein
LKTAVSLDGVQTATINLPEQDESIPLNSKVMVIGWGDTQNVTESSRFLRAVKVYTIDDSKCAKIWKSRKTDRMICASAPGKDSCTVIKSWQIF